MGALVSVASFGERALSFIGRGTLSLFKSGGGLRWNWPSNGGDRGPPGSWQMNLNADTGNPSALVAFSAVYACVQIIAGDIAKLPIQVLSNKGGGIFDNLPDDVIALLMRRPNGYQTRVDFIQSFVLSYLIYGNAYVLILRNGRNEPRELHIWDPRKAFPHVAPDGSVFYQLSGNVLAQVPSGAMVPARDIIHHRMPLSAGDPLIGVTPIYAAAASSAMGIRILQNSQKFFSNMSRPSGTLTAPGKISPETAARLKEEWDTNYTEERLGKTAVLGEGLAWSAMTINAVDAQLIEQLRWSVEDIARVFRIPTFLIGDTTKVSYRNTDQLGRMYIAGCLGYHLEAIQERFHLAFEFGNDFVFQFDLSAMLKTEIDTRYAAYEIALKSGFKTINEIRALEGDDNLKGGDEPMLQVQNQPLSVIIDNAKNPKPVPVAAPPVGAPAVPPAPPKKEADIDRVRALLSSMMENHYGT